MFLDLGSSPATMEASKAADLFGMLPGNKTMQADAIQAYTQTTLKGVPTYVRLPTDQWPQKWKDSNMKGPVCPLVLALYGHPDCGGFWEKHCNDHLEDIGFKSIPDWPSCYWHQEEGCMLIVYVDDFKCSGPSEAVDRLCKRMQEPAKNTIGIEMDPPTAPNKFLGCDHKYSERISPITGKTVKAIEYDMEEFFSSCVDRYCELAGVDRSKLKRRQTPFATDSTEGIREECTGKCSHCSGACRADTIRFPENR